MPAALHPGPFQAKVETADAREETAEGHVPTPHNFATAAFPPGQIASQPQPL